MSSIGRIALASWCSLLALSNSYADEQQSQSKISIPFVAEKPTLDGDLNDAIWQNARIIVLDTVNSPLDNVASPVKTTAKIAEDGEYLYLSFVAEDPDPSKIKGAIGDRDTQWYNDIVGIRIDTLNNRRVSYGFFVNPYGVQNDDTFNEITGESNRLWDGLWQSFGKMTETGYQVEMAIPFNILNFEQSDNKKHWPFELVRMYPRDVHMRISHIDLDRDNFCWLCQYPSAVGFEQAKFGNAVLLTPAIVANSNQTRDIYDSSDDWHDDSDLEASLDLRWGITPNTLFNGTINPDFSTVEADTGQLNVNKTFSLFYDEKRNFFLENSEYFASSLNLVYTRNIADPDYGAKLTGTQGKHHYGVLATHDTETNFLMPGNLGSTIATLNEESHATALRYRYDVAQDITIGATSTLRKTDDYHNYVSGLDGRYQINDSNSVSLQMLHSDTQYPDNFTSQFSGEHKLRATHTDSFSDQAYKFAFKHDSEYWQVNAERSAFDKNFRADLGFITKSDFTEDKIVASRIFYNDEQKNSWQEATFGGNWKSHHNENGEFIGKEITASATISGPMLSFLELNYTKADKVGNRLNENSIAIDGNTDRFAERYWNLYGNIRPTTNTDYTLDATYGDKIDYLNNRLGKFTEIYASTIWNATNHLELEVSHTYSELNADSDNVFTANLTDFRIKYQFDVYSYLKFSAVYSDIEQNLNNNPNSFTNKQEKSLSTQLIYAYKLNPQTVFFLGYSDASYQDDYLQNLRREQRTFFTKISYAWRP